MKIVQSMRRNKNIENIDASLLSDLNVIKQSKGLIVDLINVLSL